MARFSRFSRKPRFRRFRRKNKGTWFPVNGEVWTGEGTSWYDASANAYIPNVYNARDLGSNPVTFPITQDYTQQPGNAVVDPNSNPSLRDFVEGNDYFLKALIGNISIFCVVPDAYTDEQLPDPTKFWSYIQVGAGFFVARANEIAPGSPDLSSSEVDPLNGSNIQDPWIWRRTWILGNPSQGRLFHIANKGAGPTPIYAPYTQPPHNNLQLTGTENGAFFHTKSVRRIRREERLWFVIAAVGWDANVGDVSEIAALQPGYKFSLDVRIFGKMAKGRNASTF